MSEVSQFFETLFLPELLEASLNTLALTAMAMPLAVLGGLILALMRRARLFVVRWPAIAYIEVIRGTPLLVQLFLVYFTLPQLGQAMETDLLTWDKFWVGMICLAGNYAAYEAEIIRAGIEAVDPGQREAALSIGMSEWQAFFVVVMPQAFRVVIPPIINDAIAMLKDSCLVSVIGVQELLNKAQSIGKARVELPKMLVAAAAIYLVYSLVLSVIGAWAEKWLKQQTSKKADPTNIDKLTQRHGH